MNSFSSSVYACRDEMAFGVGLMPKRMGLALLVVVVVVVLVVVVVVVVAAGDSKVGSVDRENC